MVADDIFNRVAGHIRRRAAPGAGADRLVLREGTLDELGVGQIRDVFSNALFPGTSTIQTKARYFLLVPWSFHAGARPGRSGAQLREHAENIERILVQTLRAMPGQPGVIGAQRGAKVKTLPSAIYWNGSYGTGAVASLGANADGWLAARGPLRAGIQRADGILMAYAFKHRRVPPVPITASSSAGLVDELSLLALPRLWCGWCATSSQPLAEVHVARVPGAPISRGLEAIGDFRRATARRRLSAKAPRPERATRRSADRSRP